MTKWTPTLEKGTKPAYLALADAVEEAVKAGALHPGEQLPTHRDLADALGITVGTVTRGYNEARKRGIISGTVGRGTYVTAGAAVDASLVPEGQGAVAVDMGFVTPLYGCDPDMRQALSELAAQPDIQATLQYKDPVGSLQDRASALRWLALYGVSVNEDDVLICSGAQHGLCCVLTGLLHSGLTVAVEPVTYPGLKTLAAMLGIPLVPVAMDEEGMSPESLDAACRRDRIGAVFLMPGLQNPTTARMSLARRQAIAAVAERYDLILIEDCAYGLGREKPVPPFCTLAPERSVLIAGVSKYFGAGLRTAYLVVGRKLRHPLRQALFNSVWMSSPLTARLASLLIENGAAERALEQKIVEIEARNRIAAEVLASEKYQAKPDGFFLWLTLPDPWTGPRFELAAAERKISVFCGDKFAAGGGEPPNGVRVSLAAAKSQADLRFGLEVLKELLQSEPHLSALL